MNAIALVVSLIYPNGEIANLTVGNFNDYDTCSMAINRTETQMHATLSVANLVGVTCIYVNSQGDFET